MKRQNEPIFKERREDNLANPVFHTFHFSEIKGRNKVISIDLINLEPYIPFLKKHCNESIGVKFFWVSEQKNEAFTCSSVTTVQL